MHAIILYLCLVALVIITAWQRMIIEDASRNADYWRRSYCELLKTVRDTQVQARRQQGCSRFRLN